MIILFPHLSEINPPLGPPYYMAYLGLWNVIWLFCTLCLASNYKRVYIPCMPPHEKEPRDDTVNITLLCLQTGA